MENLLKDKQINIGDGVLSPFLREVGVYQDGSVPMYRDVDGTLWAMSGHSHKGHIGMFSGNSVMSLKERYPIQTDFNVGAAGTAFLGIRYPEHILARGSIWPFGLYICPKTHRFFCFFHNETGWNGQGTAYDAFGPCEKPAFDSDFRHIGLMHSDDEGKTWTFDRWVLTAEHVCFSENYVPDNENALGQKAGVVGLGSGDFSLYVEPNGEYIYLFYNIIYVDMEKGEWKACDTYVARTRKRQDGVMGDFVKYYDGSFCEAGNLGKESPIVKNAWHSRVAYSTSLKAFVMTSTAMFPNTPFPHMLGDYMHIRTSTDMIEWSEPITVKKGGKHFGNHYHTIVSAAAHGQPNVIDDEFLILTGHNGTDVIAYKTQLSSVVMVKASF